MAYSKGCEPLLIYSGLSANGSALLHYSRAKVFCCHNCYHHIYRVYNRRITLHTDACVRKMEYSV